MKAPKPPSPSAAASAIAKHLTRITHQHFFRTFEDWLALAVNAFLRDEAAYMTIMNRYGPREAPMGEKDHPADHFARALGAWMGAMQAEPADYLAGWKRRESNTGTARGSHHVSSGNAVG